MLPQARVAQALPIAQALRRSPLYVQRYLPTLQYLDYYHEIDEHLRQNRLSMVLAHPGSGKSTRCTFIEALRLVSADRRVRCGIFSKTAEKASFFMTAIGRELRQNEQLVQDFGAFYDALDPEVVWSTKAIRVIGSDRSKPTPTFLNIGATSQYESVRLTHLFMTDPTDLKTAMSRLETQRADKTLGSLMDRLDPGGRLVIEGHRFLPNDFYHVVEETRPQIKVLVLPAYHTPGNRQEANENGVPLAPEIWPHPLLLEEKKVAHKPWEWLAWYMQQKVSPEDSKFGDLPIVYVDELPEKERITAAVDVAYSTSENADYSVGVAGCQYKDGLLVTDIHDWRISGGWASRFCAFAERSGAGTMYVEINNAQTLGEECRQLVQQTGQVLRVLDHRSTARKEFRLGELAGYAEQGKLYFYRGLFKLPAFTRLLDEWRLYPNIDHDDHLDALDMLRRVIRGGRRPNIRRAKIW